MKSPGYDATSAVMRSGPITTGVVKSPFCSATSGVESPGDDTTAELKESDL